MDTPRPIPPSGRVCIASTGDAWRKEPGVVHRIGAKSPPIKAW